VIACLGCSAARFIPGRPISGYRELLAGWPPIQADGPSCQLEQVHRRHRPSDRCTPDEDRKAWGGQMSQAADGSLLLKALRVPGHMILMRFGLVITQVVNGDRLCSPYVLAAHYMGV
jgi:hypothetical protein